VDNSVLLTQFKEVVGGLSLTEKNPLFVKKAVVGKGLPVF
jgi:hypothetical protein